MKMQPIKCPLLGILIKRRFTNKKRKEKSLSQNELSQKWGIELGIVENQKEEEN